MLKKKYRIPKEVVFEKQQNISSPFFVLRFTKNEKGLNRFGFVVSKKTDKRAVVRNRVKRQVRFGIEKNFDKIKTGFDFLFIVKKQLLNKTTKEAEEIVLGELKRKKFLK